MNEVVAKKILVVDDDPDIINQVRGILEFPSVDMTNAGNANEAVRKYSELQPDLVLLDISLPGTSGFVALRRIKAKAEEIYHNVAVIMLTGKTSREDISTALAYGADDYLAKPFDRNGLITRVQKHIGNLK